MQYISHSSYLVSMEAIARLIYIYETTVKQMFASDSTKSCLSTKNTKNVLEGMPPDPPREQLIKRNLKCCPSSPTFHDLPTPLHTDR